MKQPIVHVCGGEPFSPRQSYCPFCDDTVDGIFREIFGGYGYDWVCGFCGTWISSGEYNPRISQAQRRRNVALVGSVLSRQETDKEES